MFYKENVLFHFQSLCDATVRLQNAQEAQS